MKAKHSVWKNKLVKTMFLMTVVLVAALFLGTAASAGLPSKGTSTPKQDVKESQPTVNGLAPKASSLIKTQPHTPLGGRGYFYAYNAYDPSGSIVNGPITFDTPDAIDLLAPGIFPNFCGGADMESQGAGGAWYGCDYAGGLYSIDPGTGAQTFIGSSIGVNGMAFDGTTQTWYVTSANSLYTMDVSSGATTLIGAHGVTNTFIGLACDILGNLYAYDVLWTGDSTLYSVDKATGAATAIGPMGYGFVYAQDMGYDRDNDILYIAGYFNDGSPSALLTCDISTGTCTIVGSFEGGMEVDGFAVPWVGMEYNDDIAISSIVKPASGNAAPIDPVVKVKNSGLNTEYDVDIQLEIGKEQITGTLEDFEATDGGYTHFPKTVDAWEYGTPTSGPMAAHSGSKLWATILAGNYPPSMWCGLVTPAFIVPSGAAFSFWHWYNFENSWDGGNVKITNDGGTTYTLITPVGGYPGFMNSNPYMTGQAAYTGNGNGWKKAEFDLTAYEGQLVQIMFETASDSSVQYPGWYIDDVGFTITSWVNVYDQTVTISSIAPDETIEVAFPEWTPADLGLVENTNINYLAEATNLFIDENTNNDYKAKPFSLHFGYFNDVKVNTINSPVNGLAAPQTPEVVIENVGQFDQSANVNMVISKREYGSEWKVYNPNGGNTWVRDTTGPRTGTGNAKCTYEYTAELNDDWLATPGNVVAPGGVFSFWVHGYTYNDDHYHVYISTVGNTIDDFLAGTELYSGMAPPSTYTYQSFDLSAYEGQTVYCAIFYDGNYAWYIWVDDVTLPDGTFEGFEGTTFPPMLVTLIPEYDGTTTVDIAAGETLNVSLPVWTPADLPFAMGIDYQADVEVTLNGFTPIYNYGFEDWVPAVPPGPVVFPPAGWTTYNVNGDTIQWSQYATGAHTGSYCASIGYHYPTNDDWIVTKPVMIPGGGGMFSFWWKCGSTYYAEHFKIYYSTSGNTVADFTGPNGYVIGDITYNADVLWHQFTYTMTTSEQVWFAVFCDSADALRLSLDDFTFPDGTTQGFDEGTPGVPAYWPGWTIINYGTTTDQWFGVTAGLYPTCTPPEGTTMAEYNSWNIPSGYAADLLKTGAPVDFTSATQMKFQMNHNTGYNAADIIYPLLSADGVNWWYDGTGFYQYDGTNGWKTETMDYSLLINYLGGPGYYYIGFEAVSDYGYNMFMDDISVSVFSSIPDGNPADNTMSKMFTLSYEHDVGVATITEPSYTPFKAGEVIFHQGYWLPEESWSFQNAGVGSGTVYLIQDDFWGLTDKIGDVAWWGLPLIYNSGWSEGSPDMLFDIIFYEDNAGAPGAVVASFIGLDPDFEDTGLDYIGFSQFKWSVTLPEAVEMTAGWISIQSELPADLCNLMWATGPDGNNNNIQNGVVQGLNSAYDLGKAEGGEPGGNWPPGTYQVAGIVKNLGVTYDETGFDVNTIIEFNGSVIYDYTVTVADLLAPGATAAVTFPDITILDEAAAEGVYKVTMKTMLAGDDHTNNDKKTMTFTIERPDIYPPVTTAEITGTMGQNGWYISNPVLTLTAVDPDGKWPSGVNHTYYKVDAAADWTEYSTPVPLVGDGIHTVSFYSVDKAGNVEDVQTTAQYKVDTTAPVINTYTATALNVMKNKWLLECDAEDATSGIVLVEFYADDALVGNTTELPYEFEVAGKIHTTQCIVYDEAGNSKMSDVVVSFEYESQQQYYIQLKQL